MEKSKFRNIVIKSAISDENIKIKAEVIRIEKHGYNCESGAWRLNPGRGDTPAEFLIFREYRKRKYSRINTDRVVAIEEIEV